MSIRYLVPRRYATDLTDAEWALMKLVVDIPQTGRGRRRTVDLRAMTNALLYKLRTGCRGCWPRDFPRRSTVRLRLWTARAPEAPPAWTWHH